MTNERWLRVKGIYHAACDLAPGERVGYLGEACGADADLRREVESLLAEDGSRAAILDGAANTSPAVVTMSSGTRLGPYRIEASIGKGGMGEVWRARDTRLNRDVAVKISAEQFTDRFEREARAIAALNHSNICTLYDIGPNYLVMELVEGPTLADRIKRGPIPVEEAIAIAKQIADALEAAHEKGIVHRDLKPANIKIRLDGSVKVLDFGLAKSGVEGGTADETLTATTPGMIMGTAGYMPPEQARGEKVDKRADIWAFGVVLYEMTTGRRLFEDKTTSDTMAAVIKEEPDWGRAPAKVRRLLRACLEKDPRRRLRDIGDIERSLEEPPGPVATSRSRLAWIAAGTFALVTVVLAVRTWHSSQTNSGPVARFSMDIAPAEMLGGTASLVSRPSRTAIAFSPDGRTVVFSASRGNITQLYRRALDSSQAAAMPGTENAVYPFFSPDGEWLGFQAGNKLMKISMNGGPPEIVCDLTGFIFGASWGSANTIVFASPVGTGLMRVAAAGGAPQMLLRADSAKGEVYSSPEWLPDEKTILFTVRTSDDWNDARIVARRLDTGQQHELIRGADPRYIPTGHLIFMRNAVLMAVPFDDRRGQLTGQPVALLEGVMQAVDTISTGSETGMGQFAVSSTGNLIYASGGIYQKPVFTLVRVDRKGAMTELSERRATYLGLRVSPDGQKLAYMAPPDNSLRSDVWSYDMLQGPGTRLSSQGNNDWPIWPPDGKRLLFASGHRGNLTIVSVAADGSDAAEPLFTKGQASGDEYPASLSPDGKWLAYIMFNNGNFQIWVRPTNGEGEPRQFPGSRFSLMDAEFSPDGRWMTYSSNESGAPEIYVQAFPGPGEKHRVSTNGGRNPVWARNGRELFYLVPVGTGRLRMMEVDVVPGDTFKAGTPRVLFEGNWQLSQPMRSYDITPDGKYFIMARTEPLPDQRVTRLNVVLNWFDEVRKRAPRSVQ